MKKLIPSLGLAQLTILGLAQFVEMILLAMTGNPNFTVPTPTLAAILAKLDDYRKAITDADAKVPGALALRNQLRVELSIMIRDLANYCVLIAAGDPAIFLTSGFKLRKQSQPAPDPLDAAANARLMSTSSETELKLFFDPVQYGKSYEIYISENDDQHFAYLTTISSQRYIIRSLIPGKRYFVKVKAVGPKGIQGGFSNVASRIAA